MNQGDLADPLHGLASALNNVRLKVGQTIWLRAGTYSGDFITSLAGTVVQPITIRGYPGERATIDGTLSIVNPYIIWRDLEITKLINTGRQSAQSGSTPTDIEIANTSGASGIDIHAVGTKVINCVIHDIVGNGIGLWSDASGSELYGNIIYYNGWDGPTRGNGHGIYTQNTSTLNTIKDNILFDGFELNIKCYGESGPVHNYMIDGNTPFRAGQLVSVNPAGSAYWNIFAGSLTPGAISRNFTIQNNLTYHTKTGKPSNMLGYTGGIADSSIQNNRFIAPVAMSLLNDTNVIADGNTFIGTIEEFVSGDYPDNTYGSYPAIGNVAIVRPNVYQAGRANITIYNEAQANSVSVNVSAVLANGAAYRLRNAQDYYSDWQTGTVSGGTISVNMQAANRTVATPNGVAAPSKTFPAFGAFVLEAA